MRMSFMYLFYVLLQSLNKLYLAGMIQPPLHTVNDSNKNYLNIKRLESIWIGYLFIDTITHEFPEQVSPFAMREG